MKTTLGAILGLAWLTTLALASDPPVGADGVIQFDPPQPVSCIAVRVDVPDDKMVTGLRWYNGSDAEAIPALLVASGNGMKPPVLAEAVVMAENVTGSQNAWSEQEFSDPVASQSGTLFVIVRYPDNYSCEPGDTPLGVGFRYGASGEHYFMTGDGENWLKVSSDCHVLLEPILAARQSGVISLRAPGGRNADLVPAEVKFALQAAPNPFNPQTSIDFYVPAATRGDVRVFDIRGRLVVELFSGELKQGRNAFVWQGRDRSGRAVASGAYWVYARTENNALTRKLLLLK